MTRRAKTAALGGLVVGLLAAGCELVVGDDGRALGHDAGVDATSPPDASPTLDAALDAASPDDANATDDAADDAGSDDAGCKKACVNKLGMCEQNCADAAACIQKCVTKCVACMGPGSCQAECQ